MSRSAPFSSSAYIAAASAPSRVFDPAELGGTVTQMLATTGTKGYALFP
ncbi:MAG TPA: hypothetical protein VKD02_03535 [Methyloceanibacter sp.]|nr:hypothetical protein [Methyloceanibacter sp.]